MSLQAKSPMVIVAVGIGTWSSIQILRKRYMSLSTTSQPGKYPSESKELIHL